MAHEIDMSNGRANVVLARTPAWHGLGRVMPDSITTDEAYVQAGLDWSVSLRPVYRHDNNEKLTPVGNRKVVVRNDTDKVLGIVGNQYRPVQNNSLKEFVDLVIGLGARIESGGSLHGGKKIWFLCSLKESFDVVPGDQVLPYALFMNGHDGKTRMRVVPTSVRVVCQNTLTLATDRETAGMTLRHDGSISSKIEQAKQALGLVYTRTQRLEEEAKALVRRQLRTQEMAEFFVRQIKSLGASTEKEAKVMNELMLILASNTCDASNIRGTAWSAYNAWSEWVDHSPKKVSQDVRLESVWIGKGHRQKASAWQQALALTS
mgnify:CR=1 FL=1